MNQIHLGIVTNSYETPYLYNARRKVNDASRLQ